MRRQSIVRGFAVNTCHWVALKSMYLSALKTSMKINGSVGETFLIY
jgi:hypothetical protein